MSILNHGDGGLKQEMLENFGNRLGPGWFSGSLRGVPDSNRTGKPHFVSHVRATARRAAPCDRDSAADFRSFDRNSDGERLESHELTHWLS